MKYKCEECDERFESDEEEPVCPFCGSTDVEEMDDDDES